MRYLMTLALLPAGAVIAQPTVTSTRAEAAQSMCRDSSSAIPSSHTLADKAEDACNKRALGAPEPLSEMPADGYRLTAEERGVVAPAPTPHPSSDPVPNSADVPLSFNDPVYANVTSGTTNIALQPDSSRTDLSIIENSGDPTITCLGSCNLTRVRIQSREGIRCKGGNINLTWVYIEATGVENDHADGLQCYAPGSTGTVTVKNSTFKMAGVTTAGYWSADGWQGSHVLENVLFEGGSYGLRIPADGGSSVSLKNVYFVRGSFRYRAFLFDVVKGRRINIAQWENVRWASWEGDRLVLGNLIPRPAAYPPR
ncbi:hypothetical protein [Bradyrhizobium sp. Leo121]|uniref:hypothetical protein n=1 Tax=Bradyrhizobium sp. Leo121 TaxID=1571195 RepID=UPI001028B6CC|nr:hypothetical protein [Bradyrhizobium sp. Leo121]RZN33396.1 hypothetical protein CWO90_09945 [Bradyrhizobium sp. Leo121]